MTLLMSLAALAAAVFARVTAFADRLLLPFVHPALRMAGIFTASGKDVQTILAEMKALQTEYKGKPMPQDVGERFEALGEEAKHLQDEAERDAQIKRFDAFSREVPDTTMPPSSAEKKADEVVGYVGFGEMYVNSAEFKAFTGASMPKVGEAARFGVKGARADMLVGVTREMVEKKVIDASGLIQPDRVNRIVEAARPQRLFLRDLVEVLRTGSSSVEYITQTYTESASIVLPDGLKPSVSLVLGDAVTPVRDIAVLAPIREQTLQDAPQVQGILDGRMRTDLRKKEESEMLWGDGTGLLGIFNTPGVGAMSRGGVDDTLLDKIRRAVTDVQLAEVDPNGVVFDPLDWEDVQLLKGTDKRYVWIVVTDPATGNYRVWDLAVVVTRAVRKPGMTERRALIGAFREGATLWDRNEISAAVGWVGDDFARNKRTLRLEERVAFAAHTPFAFRYVVSANAGA